MHPCVSARFVIIALGLVGRLLSVSSCVTAQCYLNLQASRLSFGTPVSILFDPACA